MNTNWNKPLIRINTIALSRRVERILPKDMAEREQQLRTWLEHLHNGLREFIDTNKGLETEFNVDCPLTNTIMARMICFNAEDSEPIAYSVFFWLARENLESFTAQAWVKVEIEPR